jgi:hypothetical protein
MIIWVSVFGRRTTDFTSAQPAKGPGDSDTKGVTIWWAAGNTSAFILYGGLLQAPSVTFAPGDKVTVHINQTTGSVSFFKNGVAVGTAVTGLAFSNYYAAVGGQSSAAFCQTTTNFAGSFTYGTDAAY